MELDSAQLACAGDLLEREWFESNGRAGHACGTLAWVPRRRFHGLLCICREPPGPRTLLVSHLEEHVELGGRSFALGLDAAPGSRARCVGFSSWPWPRWTYDLDGAQLQREVICPEGRDAVIVRYLLHGGAPATVRVRPALVARGADQVARPRVRELSFARLGSGIRWQLGEAAVHARFAGAYHHAPSARRVRFDLDAERGEPCEDVRVEPGWLELDAAQGEAALVLSARDEELDLAEALQAERERREAWVAASGSRDPLVIRLARSVQALVAQTAGGRVLLAGHPWFEAWGRDTFTALPGVLLVTGHPEIAREVLAQYAAQRADGLVPQRLAPAGEEPSYEAVDTSLWFIRSVDEYLRATSDAQFVRSACWPAVLDILEAYRGGTRFGIRADRDGLVLTAERHRKLTWMDAAFRGRIYTPRRGKPVEVQALWVSALATGARLAARFGQPRLAAQWTALGERARESFARRFWYERGGYLYDVVDGPRGDDPRLRPNQLFAFAFEEPLATRERARRVLQVVDAHLLTPVGLRTLPPDDPDYHPRYTGPRSERDPAYHNGTVWPYLLAPYLKTLLYARGRGDEVVRRARGLVARVAEHLATGCVGHLPEIFDGASPHVRRGCFAQAWTSGELLLILGQELRGGDYGTRQNEPLPVVAQ